VRWKDREEDLVAVAEIYEIVREMAAVAVKDEETILPSRFLFREALEHLFELGYPKLVIALSC
jgi:hypothetical protein